MGTCAKFKVWMTIAESGWNVRVWLTGGGCGCKEVYRFPHYLSILLYLLFFAAASLLFVHKKKKNSFFIIESTDSINRDERDVPLMQYITNAGISRARYTITHFKHHHRVL